MTRSSLLVVVLLSMLPCPVASQDAEQPDGFLRSGQVADAATRAPLSGVIVDVPELGIRVISDDSGRVELGRLPTGRYRISAERLGYEILEGELPVPWNEDFLILLDRTRVDDPLAPGRIVGRVTEEGRNRGVSDVDITVLSPTRVRTLSNRQGRFDLRDLEPGLVEVQFARLGYLPRTTTLIVQPGRTAELSATMSTQPIELEAIEVTVRSRYLEQNGFYRRTRRYWGKQFTGAELDAMNLMVLSDLFWRVPGMTVRYDINGAAKAWSRRSRSFQAPGGCALDVYLDGMKLPGWDLDAVAPWNLEGVEVYRGLDAPARYRFGLNGGCGVVLLWTKH